MAEPAKGKKQKNHSLTEAVAARLEQEPFGQQSLIVDNLLRRYYGLGPRQFDELGEDAQRRFFENVGDPYDAGRSEVV